MSTPFEIGENVIYHPPHISPRLRAQDSVLLAFHQPFVALEDRDWLEIVTRHDAHDDIRRLDQYGVFDRQLFPDPGRHRQVAPVLGLREQGGAVMRVWEGAGQTCFGRPRMGR